MSTSDTAQTIELLLSHNGPLSVDQVKDLQNALNSEGYTKNFSQFGADGGLGTQTRLDIVDYLRDNPEKIAGLSQSMKKDLINSGFGDELAEIVKDAGLQDSLRTQVDKILEGKNGLWELSKSELEMVQANWSLLGTYPSHLKVDGLIGRGSKAAYDDYCGCDPEVSEDCWRIEAQMTGTETNDVGGKVATGTLTLISPDGEEHSYDFRSGGFGKGMLPGLQEDLLTTKEGVNATYEFDYSSFAINYDDLPEAMLGEDDVGSWVRLGSDRDQTDRGAVVGKDSSNFFGIHTDGDSGSGSVNDGTKGCIGLDPEVAKEFFAKLRSIPSGQRPTQLEVIPPKETEAVADNRPEATLTNTGLSPT